MTRKSLRNFLIYKLHDQALEQAASKYLKGRLLDIGCGVKHYASTVHPFVTEHIGLHHADSLHSQENVDLLGKASNISAADHTFDSTICTSVLEHLEEPELALKECFRILKPNGIAIYTVPFIWHLHQEPRGGYRPNLGPLRWFNIVDAIVVLLPGLALLLNKIDRAEHSAFISLVAVKKYG